jgi:hypothetical protein
VHKIIAIAFIFLFYESDEILWKLSFSCQYFFTAISSEVCLLGRINNQRQVRCITEAIYDQVTGFQHAGLASLLVCMLALHGSLNRTFISE